MRKATWTVDREGRHTGAMDGIDEQSLYNVAGEQYDEAAAAMAKAPHRWGEWAAVFHPRFAGQIVGYCRLRPKDWFTLNAETDEVTGPYGTKRHALYSLRSKTSRIVRSGVYAVGDSNEMLVFTRDRAEGLGLTEEQLT
jgi:SLT domain-containing protein